MSTFVSLLVTEPIGGLDDVITEIPLDVRVSTNHSFSAQVTEYPVESGAVITDHVHLRPVSITLEGLVSDSPVNVLPNSITPLKGDVNTGWNGVSTRSQDAYDVLQDVYTNRLPITYVSRYATFEDMIIEKLDIPQSRDRGSGALWFTLSLKKITTVETLAAALPPDVVAALKRRRKKTAQARAGTTADKLEKQLSSKVSSGRQSTTDATTTSTGWTTEALSGTAGQNAKQRTEWKTESL